MLLEDISQGVHDTAEIRAARDRIIDEYLQATSDLELEVIREALAREHDRISQAMGKIVRRCEPRTSPVVRAYIFALLPGPGREGVQS